jgi:NAD(P)H-quinone oxidoreductase subunit 5
MNLAALPFASLLMLILVAVVAFRGPGLRPVLTLRLAQGAGLGAIGVAALSTWALLAHGPASSPILLGSDAMGLSTRLDALSVTMLWLSSLLGWVVLRFSATYLDGEPAQGRFMGWMLLALAGVTGFVSAGNLGLLLLGWIGAGVALGQLLRFYRTRATAMAAAKRASAASHLSDAALFAGAITLTWAFGTGDIATLNAIATGPAAGAGVALMVLAAVLKSVQFPLHGWLTEVMEAPTPVSALLHAGIVNAGGFLLVRFADLLLGAPGLMALLALLGGFTAIFGAMAMLAQPAVKTSLAWSTIAQMGFMMLQVGFGLFALAALHIVAHSLYKAHAFLATGSAIAQVRDARRPGPVAVPSGRVVLRAFALALAIFAAVGMLFGVTDKPAQAFALGAILVFGVAYLIAQGLADAAPAALTRRTLAASFATSVAYFLLHAGADWTLSGVVPATPEPGALEWAVMVLTLLSFGGVALAQALFPLWAAHPAAQGLRVHLANGLYVPLILSRLSGAYSPKKS